MCLIETPRNLIFIKILIFIYSCDASTSYHIWESTKLCYAYYEYDTMNISEGSPNFFAKRILFGEASKSTSARTEIQVILI
jgi:hypothetical protein